MKNFKTKIMAVIAVLLLAGIYYYVALPAINIHSTGFWIFLIYKFLDFQRVLNRAEREYLIVVNAFKVRLDRLCTGR